MNKKDIMRQPSMESLLQEMIRHRPGVTSARLFDAAKEWAGCPKDDEPTDDEEGKSPRRMWTVTDTWEFEALLLKLRGGPFMCVNKQWQEKGYVAERDPQGPPKVDPRQTRMDW